MIPAPRLLDPNGSYTFHSYFEMRHNIADILTDLGYTYSRRELNLPQSDRALELGALKATLKRNLRRIDPASETARQQALIAPVLVELCEVIDAQLDIEYPISVSNWLKGIVDYRIAAGSSLLIVEAKQADLTHGFVQLAVELIALSEWIDGDDPILHGAVTTGEDWRFGTLERTRRHITQDIELYRVPEDVERLIRVLILAAQPNA